MSQIRPLRIIEVETCLWVFILNVKRVFEASPYSLTSRNSRSAVNCWVLRPKSVKW